MDWQLMLMILLGIVLFFVLCCFWAVIEAVWRKRQEAIKWTRYIDRGRGGKSGV